MQGSFFPWYFQFHVKKASERARKATAGWCHPHEEALKKTESQSSLYWPSLACHEYQTDAALHVAHSRDARFCSLFPTQTLCRKTATSWVPMGPAEVHNSSPRRRGFRHATALICIYATPLRRVFFLLKWLCSSVVHSAESRRSAAIRSQNPFLFGFFFLIQEK